MYSNCIKKVAPSINYGITISRAEIPDAGEDQSSIIYTCNKPMCNSKENAVRVRELLASAQVIAKPNGTTVTGSGAFTPFCGKQQSMIAALMMLSQLVLFNL